MSKDTWSMGNPVENLVCVYLGRVWVCLNKANLWSEITIRFNWWRTRSFLESLIMYSCSKRLAHPFRWISWTMCLVSSLSHSRGNYKFFSLSFLRYFGLIISCILLCKDEICSKDDFFLCSDIYPIPVIFVILWWEIGAKSSFLVYQSYFRGMYQP